MRIETERLVLYTISNAEMESLIKNENDADLKQAYSEMLQGCINEPEKRIWYAVWLMELKNHPGTIVGDFCFKGSQYWDRILNQLNGHKFLIVGNVNAITYKEIFPLIKEDKIWLGYGFR